VTASSGEESEDLEGRSSGHLVQSAPDQLRSDGAVCSDHAKPVCAFLLELRRLKGNVHDSMLQKSIHPGGERYPRAESSATMNFWLSDGSGRGARESAPATVPELRDAVARGRERVVARLLRTLPLGLVGLGLLVFLLPLLLERPRVPPRSRPPTARGGSCPPSPRRARPTWSAAPRCARPRRSGRRSSRPGRRSLRADWCRRARSGRYSCRGRRAPCGPASRAPDVVDHVVHGVHRRAPPQPVGALAPERRPAAKLAKSLDAIMRHAKLFDDNAAVGIASDSSKEAQDCLLPWRRCLHAGPARATWTAGPYPSDMRAVDQVRM